MPKGPTEKSRAKARKFLGDLSGVSIDDLCSVYETATLAGEGWHAGINWPITGGAESWPGRMMAEGYDRCFSIRQLIAWELAHRQDVSPHVVLRRIRALADWAEAAGGDEVVESLKAAVASICPDCYSVGQEARWSCCRAKAAA
jgi:hypothetical protein